VRFGIGLIGGCVGCEVGCGVGWAGCTGGTWGVDLIIFWGGIGATRFTAAFCVR